MADSIALYEWDEAKSDANYLRRGFGFDHAVAVFDNPTLEFDDHRRDYGEQRIRVVGQVDDDVFVVYTRRGDVRRIISARLANRKERHAYRSVYG